MASTIVFVHKRLVMLLLKTVWQNECDSTVLAYLWVWTFWSYLEAFSRAGCSLEVVCYWSINCLFVLSNLPTAVLSVDSLYIGSLPVSEHFPQLDCCSWCATAPILWANDCSCWFVFDRSISLVSSFSNLNFSVGRLLGSVWPGRCPLDLTPCLLKSVFGSLPSMGDPPLHTQADPW